MQECLVEICHDFERLEGFLKDQTPEKEALTHELFHKFMDCFYTLGAEKLQYPKEFQNDVKLYHQGFEPLLKKFSDIQIRYLMLSDFYDFVRITKMYIKK